MLHIWYAYACVCVLTSPIICRTWFIVFIYNLFGSDPSRSELQPKNIMLRASSSERRKVLYSTGSTVTAGACKCWEHSEPPTDTNDLPDRLSKLQTIQTDNFKLSFNDQSVIWVGCFDSDEWPGCRCSSDVRPRWRLQSSALPYPWASVRHFETKSKKSNVNSERARLRNLDSLDKTRLWPYMTWSKNIA